MDVETGTMAGVVPLDWQPPLAPAPDGRISFVIRLPVEFEGGVQRLLTLICKSNCAPGADAFDPSSAEVVLAKCSAETACEVASTFGPIQTRTCQLPSLLASGVDIDTNRSEPINAGWGERPTRTATEKIPILERIRDRHSQRPG